MTTGEKIRQYRKLKQLTQKALAEKSGISEISIRKYEAGERIPKQDQLHKIAEALEIGENYLSNIKFDNLSIKTVGDFMSLIFMLEDNIDMQFDCEYLTNYTADPDTITLRFQNPKINAALAELLTQRNSRCNRINFVNHAINPGFSPSDIERIAVIDTSFREIEQTTHAENTEPLNDETPL